jgi:hypothetical protein
LAVAQHHDIHGFYPAGGWGILWVGNPGCGYGSGQPGGWIYSILDFVEEGNTKKMYTGRTGSGQVNAITTVCATPIPLFVCPSRRPAGAWAFVEQPVLEADDIVAIPLTTAARSDYGINRGDYGNGEATSSYPLTLAAGASGSFAWYDTSKFTGISYGCSEVKMRQVTDGTSKTYMVGEKNVAIPYYYSGQDIGDNETLFNGFDNDSGRSAGLPPYPVQIHIRSASAARTPASGWPFSAMVLCMLSITTLMLRFMGIWQIGKTAISYRLISMPIEARFS